MADFTDYKGMLAEGQGYAVKGAQYLSDAESYAATGVKVLSHPDAVLDGASMSEVAATLKVLLNALGGTGILTGYEMMGVKAVTSIVDGSVSGAAAGSALFPGVGSVLGAVIGATMAVFSSPGASGKTMTNAQTRQYEVITNFFMATGGQALADYYQNLLDAWRIDKYGKPPGGYGAFSPNQLQQMHDTIATHYTGDFDAVDVALVRMPPFQLMQDNDSESYGQRWFVIYWIATWAMLGATSKTIGSSLDKMRDELEVAYRDDSAHGATGRNLITALVDYYQNLAAQAPAPRPPRMVLTGSNVASYGIIVNKAALGLRWMQIDPQLFIQPDSVSQTPKSSTQTKQIALGAGIVGAALLWKSGFLKNLLPSLTRNRHR